MRLVVVDPRLLVRAYALPQSRSAKLMALLAYGRVTLSAAGHAHDEKDGMLELLHERGVAIDEDEREALRRRAETEQELAQRRQALMAEALEQHVPDDLVLATSKPLLSELVVIAQALQSTAAPHVQPAVVKRQVTSHTWRTITEDLGAAPFYLGAERHSPREYLIHTAVMTDAWSLVTNDTTLQLPGDACHRDPRSGRTVRPYSLDEFISDQLPYNLDLNAIDAKTVLTAATRPVRASERA